MFDLIKFVWGVVAFLFVMSGYRFAQAVVANYLGDVTARINGRATIHPQAHLDGLGLFVFLITGRLGWSKSLSVNTSGLKFPRRDELLILLSGGMFCFLWALAVAMPLFYLSEYLPGTLRDFLWIVVNTTLRFGVFNLLPLPALDGTRIVRVFCNRKWQNKLDDYFEAKIYGALFIVFDLILLAPLIGSSLILRVVETIHLAVVTLLFVGG